jgi:hypothetical protein
MRRIIVVYAILIGLIPLLTISALHFLPSPQVNTLVSGKTVIPNGPMPKFYTYENNIYGISIKYPSVWQKVEFDKDNLIASFYSPTENESGLLENVVLQVVGLPYHNKTTLRDIIREEISTYKLELPAFHLLGSGSKAILSGIPTYEIEYSHTMDRLQISTIEILTLKGNEAYKIIFSADTPEYTNLLSTVEKMINSFNIKNSEHQSTLTLV